MLEQREKGRELEIMRTAMEVSREVMPCMMQSRGKGHKKMQGCSA